MTTLKTYVEWITKVLQENPELGEVQVITASDDESNSFHGVYYKPTKGWLTADGDFTSSEHPVNAVCLN